MAVEFAEIFGGGPSNTGTSFDVFTDVTLVSARAAILFVVSVQGTGDDTGVTFSGVAMNAVGYTAADTDTEPGFIRAYFLDDILTGANRTCTVSRVNDATWMYAFGASVTALGACEVYLPGVKTYGGSATNTGASTSGTGTGTLAETTVDDGSPGTNSMRFAARYTGAASPGTNGPNSTFMDNWDLTSFGMSCVRETTAGQGARNVGFTTATDDLAAILLAVREVPATRVPYIDRTYRQLLTQ